MIPLTAAQRRIVEELIAAGYAREEAEILVVESAEDVDLETLRRET